MTATQNNLAPYASAAREYLLRGWKGVLPLPPGKKSPPPVDYTGDEGGWPATATIDEWVRCNGHGNIGLRLPDGVIGIDVDHYGLKTGAESIATFEVKHGPLPPTWISTARDLPSGIRFFRVPSGTKLKERSLAHVEIIQRHHRYVCVWPSTNPKAGDAPYLFISPDGEIGCPPPRPDELPELPEAWLKALDENAAEEPAAPGEPPKADRSTRAAAVDRALADSLGRLYAGHHGAAAQGSIALVRLESLGYPGAGDALESLGASFISSVIGNGSRKPDEAEAEWRHLVDSARAKVRTTASKAPPWEDRSRRDDVNIDDLIGDEGKPAAPPPPGPSAPSRPWPVLDEAALWGLAGDVVRATLPHTEADGAALLVDYLVSFGNAVGPGPHALADGSEHPPRLYAVLGGQTSKARKGTSRAQIDRVYKVADPGWSKYRVVGGLASGEGLIAAVRDGDPSDELDMGVLDKRMLVVEPEFARLLTVAGRDSNTLSAIVREAFDSGTLRVMTRKEPLCATGAHISILAHVTVEELRKRLSETESANGFANRFLYLAVKRSKLLPSGGDPDPDVLADLGERTRIALLAASRVGRMRRSLEAEALWAKLYAEMAEGPEGLLGAVTARSEALVLRLSVAYALLDDQPGTIGVEHLEAAWALWRYCAASAAFIFGDATGDEVADRLLAGIRGAGKAGLDGTEQSALFSRNVSAARLNAARQMLEAKGLVYTTTAAGTGGRPRQVTRAR